MARSTPAQKPRGAAKRMRRGGLELLNLNSPAYPTLRLLLAAVKPCGYQMGIVLPKAKHPAQGRTHRPMRVSTFIASAAAMITLAACSSVGGGLDTRQNAGPCPTVGALYEAGRIVKFDGDSETYRNISYTGEIVGVRLFCRYVDDEPLLAEVEIGFAFGQGPKGAERRHNYEYFVAVTRRNRIVLERETFTIEADFKDGPVTSGADLVGRIVIPRKDDSISGGNFEVLVGFELTDAQLEFNKDGKRFRLDAGT